MIASAKRRRLRSARVDTLTLIAASAMGFLAIANSAQAQTMTDAVTVKVGGSVVTCQGFSKSFPFGSVSPAVTSNGYAYQEICDAPAVNRRGFGSPPAALISIAFPSNPGKAWLTSVSALGVTLTGSSATYLYSGGVATWSWSPTIWGLGTKENSTVQINCTHLAPPLGYLDLKYQIVGVDYAPPGSKSIVSYQNNTVRGTAATNSHSYKTDTKITDTADIGISLFGLEKGGLTTTVSLDYQQTSSNGSSVTVTNTTMLTNTVPGPSSSTVGVDHDYDVIWVWLNPVAAEYVGINTVSFAGYAYNGEDDYAGPEIVPIQVAQLKNPSLMPAGLVDRLERRWDLSGPGGLTSNDYLAILEADPFATDSSYNPLTDTNHRFQAAVDQSIPYEPPAPGGQPVTVTGSFMTTTATSTSQSATYQYGVGFTLAFSAQADWIAEFASKLQFSSTYTTTDMWSSTLNSQVGKTASYSITGPQYSDHYTGPVSFQVYRDNVYGSFMFYPL